MNPRLLSFVSTALTLLLASCASLLGPRDVEVPLSTLQDAVSRKFPFNSRYLELLDINVSNPRIAMQPESNRVLTSMDVSFAPPFMNRSWNGNFAVSGRLRFDAARNAIVMAEPHVEKFAVDGLDMPYAAQLVKIGRVLTEELLQDVPLYTFRPDDLHRAGTYFTPSRISTTARGLVVTLVPAR
jgi:hypothetical protein